MPASRPARRPSRRLVALTAAALAAVVILAAPVLAGITDQTMGAGGAWLDLDGDGFLDLVYLTPDGHITVLRYDPAQDTFEDRTAIAIPPLLRSSTIPMEGLSAGDLNNDGFDDLFLTCNGPNYILLGNGDGTFRALSRSAGIVGGMTPVGDGTWVQGEGLSASSAMFDYDNDGLLDIYVTNYGDYFLGGYANQLFHNTGVDEQGNPHFVDVAPALHMDLATQGESDWSLGLTVGDYDNDGDMDLYVGNDFNGPDWSGYLNPGPNILYRNEGDGTFTDVSYTAGATDTSWTMGVTFGDFNEDGYLDIFSANFWDDRLYRNNGDGTFTNVAADMGLVAADPRKENGWGNAFIDIDNDGDLDLHVANGYIPTDLGLTPGHPNELWENLGPDSPTPYHFHEVGHAAGIDDAGDARGAVYGDFNRDGFIDFLVINNSFVSGPETNTAPLRILYVNQKNGTFWDRTVHYGLRTSPPDLPAPAPRGDFSGNHWVQFALRGSKSNRSAIGARVTVTAGDRTWMRELGQSSYCSANSPYLHFGLGQHATLDAVTVRFPSGKVVQLAPEDRGVDQLITVVEPDETPVGILSFGITSAAEGARIRWRYRDDGDLASFTLYRNDSGTEAPVAAGLRTRNGEGEYLDRTVPADRMVVYTLEAIYRDGSRERVKSQTFRFRPPVAAAVRQNFPNPFASATTIPVLAPGGGAVAVDVFDVSGRRVRRLEAVLAAGEGSLAWDGTDEGGREVPAGIYFYRVEGSSTTLKMLRRR